MNNVVLVGRLTKEPEIRYTTSNKGVANFTLAVTRKYKNQDGVYETDFINCEIWGNIVETMKDYCHKGDMIGTRGSIRTDNYEVDGQKKYRTYVSCDRLTFLSSKPKEETPKKEEDPFKAFGDKIGNDLPVDEGMPW